MDKHKTQVQFLINDGDLFAYFPNIAENGNLKSCYASVGGHSACHPEYATDSKAATPDEYEGLYAELTSIGYNLEIIHAQG